MKIRSQHHCDRQTHGDQLQKGRSRLSGDPEPECRVESEGEHQESESDETPFFPDVSGDEVVISERQEAVLLAPSSKSNAEDLACPHRYQRLTELIAHLQGCRARIEEGRHPQQ